MVRFGELVIRPIAKSNETSRLTTCQGGTSWDVTEFAMELWLWVMRSRHNNYIGQWDKFFLFSICYYLFGLYASLTACKLYTRFLP